MKKFILSAITVLSLTAPAFASEYLRACHDNDSDYLETLLTINDNNWIITHTAFEDQDCKTPYLMYEVQYKTYQSDQNIDMTALEVSYTSTSELVAEVLNQIYWCGFSDWKAFEKKVVTGKVCDEFQTPKFGEILYSVAEKKGNEIYLGMPSAKYNGKTPEQRHQSLDPLGFILIK